MLTKIKLFFTDAAYFDATFEQWKPLIKGAMLGLGAAVSGGQLDLGAFGWWAGPIILAASGLIQKTAKP